MEASIVDLRYRMKDVLKAIDRNEDVLILYHGKVKATIRAAGKARAMKVAQHPFFKMCPSSRVVAEEMDVLRGGRNRAL
jgi:antitoxin (DNA-binding transcriptional repressor) of toxin-antitoxin stability system